MTTSQLIEQDLSRNLSVTPGLNRVLFQDLPRKEIAEYWLHEIAVDAFLMRAEDEGRI